MILFDGFIILSGSEGSSMISGSKGSMVSFVDVVVDVDVVVGADVVLDVDVVEDVDLAVDVDVVDEAVDMEGSMVSFSAISSVLSDMTSDAKLSLEHLAVSGISFPQIKG